jgi:hypothetical protein
MDDPENENQWDKLYSRWRSTVYWRDYNGTMRRQVRLTVCRTLFMVSDARRVMGPGSRTIAYWKLDEPPSYLTPYDIQYITTPSAPE